MLVQDCMAFTLQAYTVAGEKWWRTKREKGASAIYDPKSAGHHCQSSAAIFPDTISLLVLRHLGPLTGLLFLILLYV